MTEMKLFRASISVHLDSSKAVLEEGAVVHVSVAGAARRKKGWGGGLWGAPFEREPSESDDPFIWGAMDVMQNSITDNDINNLIGIIEDDASGNARELSRAYGYFQPLEHFS